MALYIFNNILKCYKPLRVSNFSINDCIALSGLQISNSYVTDIQKQKEFAQIAEGWDTSISKQKTSKAMKAYLERAKQHDEFLKQQEIAYSIGKRHLANIMGEDPATFTDNDVNAAIEYLFPSGIYDPRARPLMKPPHEVFPPRKGAEFDESGRPHHFLFYTGKPNFYQVMFDLYEKITELNNFHDGLIKNKVELDYSTILDNNGYTWLKKEEFEKVILETVMDREYDSFIQTMERLMNMPNSNRFKEFVDRFRQPLLGQKKTFEIESPKYDENGRAFVTTYECLRKAARGHVTIRSPGTGIVTINGKDITYFEETQHREQIMFPLLFTDMMNSVDVECHVEGGGPSGQAGAMRWGIAWTLRSFVDKDMVERMRLAGLLSRDNRLRERKLPGQPGARRQPTWKKR